MNTKYLFCLSGWGYLCDIIERNGQMFAGINMLMHPNNSTFDKDDVHLQCEVVNESHQACLKAFMDLKQAGNCIMINFVAEYSAFINAYSGQAPEDPNHMVTLQAKLHSLRSCSIDGRSALTESVRLRAAA